MILDKEYIPIAPSNLFPLTEVRCYACGAYHNKQVCPYCSRMATPIIKKEPLFFREKDMIDVTTIGDTSKQYIDMNGNKVY